MGTVPTADDCRRTSFWLEDGSGPGGQAVKIAVALAVQPLQTQPRDLVGTLLQHYLITRCMPLKPRGPCSPHQL